MRYLLTLVFTSAAWLPALTWAAEEELTASYRGIATIYYVLIWGILSYGLYDAFGRKALYVGAPILALIIYFILPSV